MNRRSGLRQALYYTYSSKLCQDLILPNMSVSYAGESRDQRYASENPNGNGSIDTTKFCAVLRHILSESSGGCMNGERQWLRCNIYSHMSLPLLLPADR